jgi:hypothetical protein
MDPSTEGQRHVLELNLLKVVALERRNLLVRLHLRKLRLELADRAARALECGPLGIERGLVDIGAGGGCE